MLQRSGELNQNSCSQKLVFKWFCERSALSVLIAQSTTTAAGHRHYRTSDPKLPTLFRSKGKTHNLGNAIHTHYNLVLQILHPVARLIKMWGEKMQLLAVICKSLVYETCQTHGQCA